MRFEKTEGRKLGTVYLLVALVLTPLFIFVFSSYFFATLFAIIGLYGVLLIRANPTWSIAIEGGNVFIFDWDKEEKIEIKKIIRLELIDAGDDAGLYGLKIDGDNRLIELPSQLNNYSADIFTQLRRENPMIRLDRVEERIPSELIEVIRKAFKHLKKLALTNRVHSV